MKRKDAIELIKVKMGCDDRRLEMYSRVVNNLCDQSFDILLDWLQTDKISSYGVNDVDMIYIMNKLNIDFMAAIIHLDKFIKEPEETLKFKKARIMRRGRR